MEVIGDDDYDPVHDRVTSGEADEQGEMDLDNDEDTDKGDNTGRCSYMTHNMCTLLIWIIKHAARLIRHTYSEACCRN